MGTSSPVFGLRPIRRPFCRMENVPNPLILTIRLSPDVKRHAPAHLPADRRTRSGTVRPACRSSQRCVHGLSSASRDAMQIVPARQRFGMETCYWIRGLRRNLPAKHNRPPSYYGRGRRIPTDAPCRQCPWPGGSIAAAHLSRTSAEPQVNPPPSASSNTRSPRRMRPSLHASAKASGTEAADVFA